MICHGRGDSQVAAPKWPPGTAKARRVLQEQKDEMDEDESDSRDGAGSSDTGSGSEDSMAA